MRRANQRIAKKAERYGFRSRVPMLCECTDPACDELVLVGLDEYRRAGRERDFLTAPGHRVDVRAA